MLAFAVDGITSFSVRPLGLISRLGALVTGVGLIGTVWAGIARFAAGWSGWIAAFWSLWLLGGLILLCLGVAGTYLGKIYAEVKARPRYKIERRQGGVPASDGPPSDAEEKTG